MWPFRRVPADRFQSLEQGDHVLLSEVAVPVYIVDRSTPGVGGGQGHVPRGAVNTSGQFWEQNSDEVIRNTPSNTQNELAERRRFYARPITTDGAGAAAAVALITPTAVAKALLWGVWSPATDAATDFTFAITGGTLVGPGTITLALTANTVSVFAAGGVPVPLSGTDGADAGLDMTVAVANGPATQTLYVIVEVWSE